MAAIPNALLLLAEDLHLRVLGSVSKRHDCHVGHVSKLPKPVEWHVGNVPHVVLRQSLVVFRTHVLCDDAITSAIPVDDPYYLAKPFGELAQKLPDVPGYDADELVGQVRLRVTQIRLMEGVS